MYLLMDESETILSASLFKSTLIPFTFNYYPCFIYLSAKLQANHKDREQVTCKLCEESSETVTWKPTKNMAISVVVF